MTKIITRYFGSAEIARRVRQELVDIHRLSPRIIDLFDQAEGLAARLDAAQVAPATAAAYAQKLAGGGAVLLVRAGHKPLSVGRITREVTAAMGAADMGGLIEEVLIKDTKVGRPNTVLGDHPLMLTRPRVPGTTTFHMANWPIQLISRRKPSTVSVIPPHGHMANFPIPLLSDRKPYTGAIFGRHARMANWPIPLISRRKPFTGSIFGLHARMVNFPIPLISRRKPFTGTVIGRHTRMASVPFPLLINGPQVANALIPDGPRMANFPIPLLSERKPFTGSIFGRHARMANFPIPLISRRKPFTGSIFPPHARMADAILPLVTRSSTPAPDADKRFSFSRLLGLPTIQSR